MKLHSNNDLPLSRRDWLAHSATGLGAMAMAALLSEEGFAAENSPGSNRSVTGVHHPPRAKRCIHIFSPGGVSQVDTFDYKPELEKLDGQPLTGKGKIEPFFGQIGKLRKSFYEFKQHGQSGAWVSSLLPHIAECVDDLTFVRTLVAKSSSH